MAGEAPIPGEDTGEAHPAFTADPVYVLVAFRLEPRYFPEIEAVDPRVRLLRSLEPPSDGEQTSAGDWRPLQGQALDDVLAKAEIIYGFGVPADRLDRAPRLRWIQLASAGADHLLREGVLDKRRDLLVTTASGIHEVPISEHIVAVILHFSRGFNVAVRQQAEHKWARYTTSEVAGKTVCLVGYGPIARRTARLLQALGMRLIAVRASIDEERPGADAVERFYPATSLNTALAQADFVVIAAPRTPQTEKMIGPVQFAAMKRSAVLVNISRGALVDEAAIIDALRRGTIAGAGLDVFEQEPLPADSPLWDMPNVLVTPHNSGSSPHYNRRATDLFCDNLARYLRGEPLRNRVVRERGY